jgi:hypothetical protein
MRRQKRGRERFYIGKDLPDVWRIVDMGVEFGYRKFSSTAAKTNPIRMAP